MQIARSLIPLNTFPVATGPSVDKSLWVRQVGKRALDPPPYREVSPSQFTKIR